MSSTGASSLIQDLPDNAEAFQYFSISGESYLAVGNRLSNDEIYRFDGSSFTGFQTLPSDIYASDFAFIDQSGSYLLAVSNQSPTSPSQIFQWTGTGFDFSYNLGEVTSHSAIESFQIRDFARESYPYAQIMADNSIIASQSSFTGYRLEETMTKAELIKLAANL